MTNSSTFVFDIMDELFTYAEYLRDSTTVHTEDISFSVNITSLNIQPNPFKDQCRISYELPETSHIKLEILDLHGNKVAEVLCNKQPAGKQEIIFNTGKLRPGIYICRLQSDKKSISKKIIKI
ncbi:MAG: T9SS type A sorting domain-containing protein [Bacteroidota bacterium]|nr:T9SS type A sorting domain-containing protein [Bacteroidota bacterium]